MGLLDVVIRMNVPTETQTVPQLLLAFPIMAEHQCAKVPAAFQILVGLTPSVVWRTTVRTVSALMASRDSPTITFKDVCAFLLSVTMTEPVLRRWCARSGGVDLLVPQGKSVLLVSFVSKVTAFKVAYRTRTASIKKSASTGTA